MHITSDRVAVTATPDELRLSPGDSTVVTLDLVNLSPNVDELRLVLEGIDNAWYTVSRESIRLFPDAAGQLQVEIHLPDSREIFAGSYPIRLLVCSREARSRIAALDLCLEVLPVGGLELVLVPQVLTTLWNGRFCARLTNRSNAEQVVDLQAADSDHELDIRPASDRIAVRPGGSEDVPLKVRPRRRSLMGPQKRFALTAMAWSIDDSPASDAGDPLALAEGTLVYQPPLHFLAELGPRTRRLLLAFGALLLLAIPLLICAGREIGTNTAPTPTPAGLSTPTVAVATTPVATPMPTASPKPTITPPVIDPKPTVLPTIATFELVHPDGSAPGSFVLKWLVQLADHVEIRRVTADHVDNLSRETSGVLDIKVLEDTQFELQATNAAGVARQAIGIYLLLPPEIQDFTATPPQVAPGQLVKFTWKSAHAEHIRLLVNGVPADLPNVANGNELELLPPQDGTTVYTIEVENELGRAQKTVRVDVVAAADSGTRGA